MIEFEHTITKSEFDSKYMNLKDNYGKRYGNHFPPHRTRLTIVDEKDRKFLASKHFTHQIWGSLRGWFETNQIQPGAVILVRYNPSEMTGDGRNIVHLESKKPGIPSTEEVEFEEVEEGKTEIPLEFEKQLEDFLEVNLEVIERGLKLFKDENGNKGRQYPTDVGDIDLLAIKPNGDFLIIELKKGRSSDVVVGQISRYLGWIKENLANGKNISGIIVTHEFDQKLKYAVIANEKLKVLYYKIRLDLVSEEEIQK